MRLRGLLAYAAVAFAAVTVALLLVPLYLFLAAPAAYGTSPSFVLGGLFVPWAATLLVALVTGALLPPRPRRAATLVLAGLAAGAVLSAFVLAGLAGGSGLAVRLVALLLPPIVLVVFRRRLGRAAVPVALVALVAAALAAAWPVARPGEWRPAPPADPLSYFGLHRLSGDGDVFHLIVDGVGTAAVEAALATDDDLASDLAGFELYADHAADVLEPSRALRSMLTGTAPATLASGTPDGRKDGGWEDSVTARLHAAGVSTLVLGAVGELCAEDAVGDCLPSDALLADQERPRLGVGNLVVDPLHGRLIDGALWRILGWHDRDTPFVAQPLLGILAGGERAAGDAETAAAAASVRAFERYLRALYVGPGERRYVLFRLPGAADRPLLPASCAAGNGDDDAEPATAESQAACALRLAGDLAGRLDGLGIYDDTAIVVQSPLGAGRVEAEALPKEWRGFTTEVGDRPAGELAAVARPLLLVKRPGASGDLATVSRPSSQRATVASLLALADVAPDEELTPPFWELAAGTPEAAARPLLVVAAGRDGYEEIVVEGPVADLGTWRHVGVFAAPGEPEASLPAVEDVRFNVRRAESADGGHQVVLDFWTTTETQAEFLVSTVAGDGSVEVLQDYSPTRTLALPVARVGCGLELLIRGRRVGSGAPAEAQATLELGPELGDCPGGRAPAPAAGLQ